MATARTSIAWNRSNIWPDVIIVNASNVMNRLYNAEDALINTLDGRDDIVPLRQRRQTPR